MAATLFLVPKKERKTLKKLLFFALLLCVFLIQGCASDTGSRRYLPEIGMSKEQVLRSTWSSPREMNKTQTARGTTEVWIYAGPSFLFFDEGGILRVINSPHLESKSSGPTQEELTRRYQEIIRQDDARRAREAMQK